MLRAVYDISVLGYASKLNIRTGIFRAAEALGQHLLDAPDCEVELSSVKFLQETTYYLKHEFPGPKRVLRSSDYRLRMNSLFDSATVRMEQTKGMAQKATRTGRRVVQMLNTACHTWDCCLDTQTLAQANVFHSSFYQIPTQIKNAPRLRRFITVYDMIPVLYPQYFNNDPDHPLHEILASLGPEDYVIAISEATKNDVCSYLKVDPARVFVTPLAADPKTFYPCEDVGRQKQVRARYGIPDAPYVLTLSTLEPRKNMDHVIRCFAQVAQEGSLKGVNLVLAGSKGWDYERIFGAMEEAKSLEGRIIWAGRVADEDLAALYSGAMAFTYMSHYEGFGLPPLEAMQCGVPVITSNTSSLPEVVGEAGITLAPDDADGLCQAMLDIGQRPALRAEMRCKSLARAAQFSWQRCAQDTIDAYAASLR